MGRKGIMLKKEKSGLEEKRGGKITNKKVDLHWERGRFPPMGESQKKRDQD